MMPRRIGYFGEKREYVKNSYLRFPALYSPCLQPSLLLVARYAFAELVTY